jgi:hypothetical protein
MDALMRAILVIAAMLAGCVSQPPEPACQQRPFDRIKQMSADDDAPVMSLDHREILFVSTRGMGHQLWHATRDDISKPFDINDVSQVMISGIGGIMGCDEQKAPWISNDRLRMWFTCNSAGGPNPSTPLWFAARSTPSAAFDMPQGVMELKNSGVVAPSLTSDELTMYFEYNDGGGQITHATRADKSSLWMPAFADPDLPPGHTPSISSDGQTIVFVQDGPDGSQIVQATGGKTAWSSPKPTGIIHVTGADDTAPKLAGDDHTITFMSPRAGVNTMFSYCE